MTITHSPWGAVQHIEHIAEGIVMVSTASHGGIKLSAERYALMPAAFRETGYSKGGWYEEDCDWALVAVTFPDAFKADDVALAKKIVARWHAEPAETVAA